MAKKVSIILGLIAVLLIAGCGNGSQISNVQSSPEPETYEPYETEEAEEAYPTEEETGGPLASVGTIVSSPEKGATYTQQYSVGPLQYASEGTPPEEVVTACFPVASGPVQRSVFARGEVTVTYSQGTLPMEYTMSTSSRHGVVTNEYGSGVMAIQVGSEWYCRSPSAFLIEFQSGESQTFPFWIIVEGALTNSQPRVPASVFDTWYFEPFISSGFGLSEEVRGPGAGECGEEYGDPIEHLYLYNRSGSCE